MIVHPRTHHRWTRWLRWQNHAGALVALHPPRWLPRLLAARIAERRYRLSDRRFARWLARYPWRPR